MKKSTLFGIILLALLIIYAIYLSLTNGTISKLKPNSNFAIEEVDQIDKIVIKDLDGSIATLEKKDNEWYVNNTYKAKPENIAILLKTVQNIKVQSSVAKISVKPVIRDISASHKKVDFYLNGKLHKTYFIGNPTQDHYGTFMLLETPSQGRSSVPYITHLPGFNGFLSSRFHSIEKDWRYTGVFTYDIENIASVEVDFKDNPNESYTIKQNNGEVSLYNKQEELVPNGDNALLKNYLINYKKIHLNRILTFTPTQVDSVKQLSPDYTITVTSTSGNTNKLALYKMAAQPGEIDAVTGLERKYNVNHIAGVVNNGKEVARYQYYVIDPLLMKLSYFKPL